MHLLAPKAGGAGGDAVVAGIDLTGHDACREGMGVFVIVCRVFVWCGEGLGRVQPTSELEVR